MHDLYLPVLGHLALLPIIYLLYCIGCGLYDIGVDFVFDTYGTACPMLAYDGTHSEAEDVHLGTFCLLGLGALIWPLAVPLAILAGIVYGVLYMARSVVRINTKLNKLDKEK